MEFSFQINSRNAAFTGGGLAEVARLLREAANQVEAGADGFQLIDFNGNHCGSWNLDEERPEFETCEAAELFQFADDFGAVMDDDPRDLSRAQLVEGLESIGVACYDEESDELLADAYGDSMLAGDLPGDCEGWRDACRNEWEG